jgi:hypothetical protein
MLDFVGIQHDRLARGVDLVLEPRLSAAAAAAQDDERRRRSGRRLGGQNALIGQELGDDFGVLGLALRRPLTVLLERVDRLRQRRQLGVRVGDLGSDLRREGCA